jgi:hypothetical protein
MRRKIFKGLICLLVLAGIVVVSDKHRVDSNEIEREAGQNSQRSDGQYLELFFQTTSVEDSKAVIARGERMVQLLVKLRGDETQILPLGLMNPDSAQSLKLVGRPYPNAKSAYDTEGDFFTKEIAALYLICAIYHQNLRFAQNPLLTDLSVPSEQRRAKNTKKLVDRAWDAVEVWTEALRKEGMNSLRRKGHHPLRGSQVAFW